MSTIITHPAQEAHPDRDGAARKRADRLAKATADHMEAALAYLSMIDPEAFEIAFTAVAEAPRQVRRRGARSALRRLRRPSRHLSRGHSQLAPLPRRRDRLRHPRDLRPGPRLRGRVVPRERGRGRVLASPPPPRVQWGHGASRVVAQRLYERHGGTPRVMVHMGDQGKRSLCRDRMSSLPRRHLADPLRRFGCPATDGCPSRPPMSR
jgi:hypothetical protein